MKNTKYIHVTETITKGIFNVSRCADSSVFAVVRSPKHSAGNAWTTIPAGSDSVNDYGKTKEDILYKLNRTAKVCSDYQLGLGPYIKGAKTGAEMIDQSK